MGLVKSVKTVINENLSNRRRLVRLAVYDLKNKNGGTVLGFLWNFLNPAFQILIYWFVFAVGLRQGADIGGVPYIVWLIAGIVPWFFMSSCMLESDTSILSFSSVLKRMTFPMAVVPVKTVAANFMTHFISVIIAFIIVAASGVNAGNQLWQMLYYMFAAVFFLISYALIGSSVTVIFRDYHNIFSFVIRMIFFISPAMWNPDTSNKTIRIIMMINPFAYIINGYRNAFFYSEPLLGSLTNGIIFWSVSILMFIVGCLLHTKLRRKFMDLL